MSTIVVRGRHLTLYNIYLWTDPETVARVELQHQCFVCTCKLISYSILPAHRIQSNISTINVNNYIYTYFSIIQVHYTTLQHV